MAATAYSLSDPFSQQHLSTIDEHAALRPFRAQRFDDSHQLIECAVRIVIRRNDDLDTAAIGEGLVS